MSTFYDFIRLQYHKSELTFAPTTFSHYVLSCWKSNVIEIKAQNN